MCVNTLGVLPPTRLKIVSFLGVERCTRCRVAVRVSQAFLPQACVHVPPYRLDVAIAVY